MGMIEVMRRDKSVRSGLEVDVTVPADPYGNSTDLDAANLAELFIVSSVAFGERVDAQPTSKHKRGRCWRHLPEVPEDGALCGRCEEVVNTMDALA
jgi:isoleucyl-tRNA synthetase